MILPINQKNSKKTKEASIKGKKITPAAQVQVSNRDKTPPNRIFVKKVQDKPSPTKQTKISENPGTLKKYSKVLSTEKVSSKTSKKASSSKQKSSKPVSKTSEIKDDDKPFPVPSIQKPKLRSIIKSSLKKEKLHKIIKEKEKKAQNYKKEQKKLDTQLHNIQIRLENKKWKKVKLHHKHDWGIDQTRLNPREHSSERPTSRKAKSTERVRNNENIRETLHDQGRSFLHNRTLSQGSDSTSHVRSKLRDPRVMEFMKNKKNELKQQQELESLQKVAQDSRKFNDLNKLELLRKALRVKGFKKKVKKAKTSRKSKDSSRVYNESKSKLQKLNLVYEPSKFADSSAESSSRQARSCLSCLNVPGKMTDRSNYQISWGKSDKRTQAAVKIQAHVRRFLVQRRIFEQMQSSMSTDEIVKEILEKKMDSATSELEFLQEKGLNRNSAKKLLEISIPSSSSSHFSDSKQDEDLLHSEKSDKIETKEKVIKMEAQLQALNYLKEKEIQDMKNIAINAGIDSEVGRMLSEIVMKRYSQLSSLLEGSISEAKEEILNEMDEEEKLEYFSEIQEKKQIMTKFIENSEKDLKKPHKAPAGESETRPVRIITSKSALNDDSQNPVDTPQFSAILSPQHNISPSHDYSIQNLTMEACVFRELSNTISEDLQSSNLNLSSEVSIQKSDSPQPFDQIYKNISVLQETSFELCSSLPAPNPTKCPKSHSPDNYIPERPSAPLNYIDSTSQSPESNPSPSVSKINSVQFDDSSCIEWTASLQLEVTPELVSQLAECILLEIIGEHEVFSNQNWDVLRIRTDPEMVLNYSENIYKYCDIDEVFQLVKVPAERNRLSVFRIIRENLYDLVKPVFCEILNLNVYLALEYHLDQVKKPNKPDFVSEEVHAWLIEAEHIHNKLVFDANNEALSAFRPKSLEIVPWACRAVRRSGLVDERVLEQVLNCVTCWSQYQVGKIFNSDLVNSSQVIDEETLQHIREENLSKVLAQEILEDDVQWQDFEFEELQTKIDLADELVEYLSQELVNILNTL